MDLIPLIPEGRPLIQGYGDFGFRIRGERFEGGVVILGDAVVPADIAALGDVTAAQIDTILAADPPVEVLLVGAGAPDEALPPALRSRLDEAAIGFEVMATGAACRTFNFLLAEERRVAAILVPVA